MRLTIGGVEVWREPGIQPRWHAATADDPASHVVAYHWPWSAWRDMRAIRRTSR